MPNKHNAGGCQCCTGCSNPDCLDIIPTPSQVTVSIPSIFQAVPTPPTKTVCPYGALVQCDACGDIGGNYILDLVEDTPERRRWLYTEDALCDVLNSSFIQTFPYTNQWPYCNTYNAVPATLVVDFQVLCVPTATAVNNCRATLNVSFDGVPETELFCCFDGDAYEWPPIENGPNPLGVGGILNLAFAAGPQGFGLHIHCEPNDSQIATVVD